MVFVHIFSIMEVCFVCSNSNSFRCEHCHCIQSCQAHFSLHYDSGKKACWPFAISQKIGVGRCLVAARDISAGELVLHDASVTSGPRDDQSVCVNCFSQGDIESGG